ncbi:unnamed protein product [Timema podura]|uniref:Uncharacterized protein n=1 Tax=Timema podura TaxID=61482 RepID=A0ABN7P1L5_TIMPD|nr:unnamed protein product [Timema podura]
MSKFMWVLLTSAERRRWGGIQRCYGVTSSH